MKSRMTALMTVLLCVAMLSPALVSAAGYENVGGFATTSITWYFTPRYISNPASPGPEVAFYQYSGNAGLFLGKHDCN